MGISNQISALVAAASLSLAVVMPVAAQTGAVTIPVSSGPPPPRTGPPPIYVEPVVPDVAPSPGISSAQRKENRAVQTALNHFDFDAGGVDGVIGRGTRAAISRYQEEMGYSVTGTLSDEEREFLTASYARALESQDVAPYDGIFAEHGTLGLLRTFRDETNGVDPDTGEELASAVQPALVLPDLDSDQMERSVSQHCNEIAVLTTTNGGFTTVASMTNPEFTLNEQFCLARTFALSQSSQMISMTGQTEEQILETCMVVTNYLNDHVETLGTEDPATTSADLIALLSQSGQTEQLLNWGRICLGFGYRTDDAKIAVASAMILIAGGKPACGEILGHHLREGFGVAQNPDQGAAWLTYTMDLLENGSDPAFLPGQSSERMSVMRAALEASSNTQTASGDGLILPTLETQN